METLSVILPAHKEPFLNNTIESLLENTSDSTEILAIVDGYVLKEPVIKHPRVRAITFPDNRGMRAALNKGMEEAKGEYIMKLDAHCEVDKNFDRKMLKEAVEDRLIIPRRLGLSDTDWLPIKDKIYDYHYLNFPNVTKYGHWYMGPAPYKRPKRDNIMVDETMMCQGSCMMANRKYFMKHVYPLDEGSYGKFYHDQSEMGLKYWLNAGGMWVNKNTWYAHLSKRNKHYKEGLFARAYKKKQAKKSHHHLINHWFNDREPGMERKFAWLVEKFSPMRGWDGWEGKWEAMSGCV